MLKRIIREAEAGNRAQATARGACRYSHVCERYVKRAWCVECAREGRKPEPKPAKRHFTGKPCKNGHVGERYAASGNCVECGRESFKRWNAKDRLRRGANEATIPGSTVD